jgi:hypothetical protein
MCIKNVNEDNNLAIFLEDMCFIIYLKRVVDEEISGKQMLK